MRRFGLAVLLTLVVILLISSTAFAQGNGPKTQPVVVINTTAEPVPVTGNVTSTITGSVNANITNAAVPVIGNVNANITNSTPLPVRDVASPNQQPFQKIVYSPRGSSDCGVNYCTVLIDTVPAGKNLVLTHFQGQVVLAPGDKPLAVGIVSSARRLFDVPRNSLACYTDPISVGGPERCPFNEAIQVTFMSGETPYIDTYLVGDLDPNGWPQSFVVSGYYIDAPAVASASSVSLQSKEAQPASNSQRRNVIQP